MKTVIKINDLEKKYDDKFKLGPINLDIPSGCIIGIIGENGAGKTTLIKLVLNIIKSNKGTIKVFEKDNIKEEQDIKENIGVVLDNSFFPEILNADNISSIMKDIYKTWDNDLFNKYISKFKLPTNKPIKEFSKGMKKKLEIATALSHHPKLLILDEPTSGLDPVVRSEILDIFLEFIQDEEHTIILSTHITSDLEHIADTIVFINEGKIELNESRDEILDNYKILKCKIEEFSKIDKTDIISYKKNKYSYEILIDKRKTNIKKYKDYIIDKITLEELMIFIIKGVK